jgi:UDP-N-acetylmuramate--alanine ligase
MASVAVGIELEIPFDTIKGALETVAGVQRRQEIKGEIQGITIMDDYGHHPTEIKHTLQAVKGSWPDKRSVVVFQPHRYTRTQALFDEFTRSFYQSDMLIVLPIYSAGEQELAGVDSQELYRSIKEHGHKAVTYVEDQAAAVDYLLQVLVPGDVMITLGAGDVWQVGETVLTELNR